MNVRRDPFLDPIAGVIAFLACLLALLATERRLRSIPAVVTGIAVTCCLVGLVDEARHHQRLRRLRARRRAPAAGQQPTPPSHTVTAATSDFRMLERVVASGQQQTRDGTTVAVLSIESYREGFILNLLISQAGLHDHRPENIRAPEVDLTVRDENHRQYTFRGLGNGSGGQWRLASRFTPPLNPGTRSLSIDLAAIRWYRFDMVHKQRSLFQTQTGPWHFTVSLYSGPDDQAFATAS